MDVFPIIYHTGNAGWLVAPLSSFAGFQYCLLVSAFLQKGPRRKLYQTTIPPGSLGSALEDIDQKT